VGRDTRMRPWSGERLKQGKHYINAFSTRTRGERGTRTRDASLSLQYPFNASDEISHTHIRVEREARAREPLSSNIHSTPQMKYLTHIYEISHTHIRNISHTYSMKYFTPLSLSHTHTHTHTHTRTHTHTQYRAGYT
jgi:hypothetical protein